MSQPVGQRAFIDIALVAIIYLLSLIVGVCILTLIIITSWQHLLQVINFDAE